MLGLARPPEAAAASQEFKTTAMSRALLRPSPANGISDFCGYFHRLTTPFCSLVLSRWSSKRFTTGAALWGKWYREGNKMWKGILYSGSPFNLNYFFISNDVVMRGVWVFDKHLFLPFYLFFIIYPFLYSFPRLFHPLEGFRNLSNYHFADSPNI